MASVVLTLTEQRQELLKQLQDAGVSPSLSTASLKTLQANSHIASEILGQFFENDAFHPREDVGYGGFNSSPSFRTREDVGYGGFNSSPSFRSLNKE